MTPDQRLRTPPDTATVNDATGDVIFSIGCSLIGIMLWALNRFEPASSGQFRTLDYNSQIVPGEVYETFVASVRNAIETLETRVNGPQL